MAILAIVITIAAAVWVTPRAQVEAAVVTSPLVGAERIQIEGQSIVSEILRAESYTYVRFEDPTDRWFVVTGEGPTPGEQVYWRGFAELRDFRSNRLDQNFSHLIFASIKTTE